MGRMGETTLHVTNGDSTGDCIAEFATDVLPWRDVLHDGPVPAVAEPELRRLRAEFLAAEFGAPAVETAPWLEERDRRLAGHPDAFVLWFEADLYDQLQVVQILARLAELDVVPDRITFVNIGEYLGIGHFGGLGELDAAQLHGLLDTAAVTLTGADLRLATDAWAAFRAPDPAGLAAIARSRSNGLRFVAEAFDRLSREYPSTRDGLGLTERRVLAAAAEAPAGESLSAGQIFGRIGAREARPYLGDTSAFQMIRRLAQPPEPLLALGGGGEVTGGTPVRLTDAGREVLAGRADAVSLHGVDRWIGGAHLSGHTVPWRWDDGLETLVPAG